MMDKICECCGRDPVTWESVDLLLENQQHVSACPHLDTDGRCRIYDRRPPGCRNYYCGTFHRHYDVTAGHAILDMFQEMTGDDGE
jgi:Fe-S-cluster containining protein